MKFIFTLFFLFLCFASGAQSFRDSTNEYLKNYVSKHEVVKGEDRKQLYFYEPDKSFRVLAHFESMKNSPWFAMPTSGPMKQMMRVYGKLRFILHDTTVTMNLYQSQDLLGLDEYKNYLFLPFTDATTGEETYEGGRYIDLKMEDIRGNTVLLDFNKAYNPYCAYVSGLYNCPIPPKENHISVAIRAGEKKYGRH
jgi:uncharacterized protein (DUF1684 family)